MSDDPVGGGGISRRRLLAGGAAGVVTASVLAAHPVAAAASGLPLAAGSSGSGDSLLTGVPATENLIREHGVLKRVLLVYDEIGRRIGAKQAVPAGVIVDAATIIHDYIEDFHEAIEEGYVFPRLKEAGQLVSTVDTLLLQHARGRTITQSILTQSTTTGLAPSASTTQVASYMALFVRMYNPHEAREDTVVFPAYRALLSDTELEEMAELVAADQKSLFGANGFTDMVNQVASIETKLGIADLSTFTPPANL